MRKPLLLLAGLLLLVGCTTVKTPPSFSTPPVASRPPVPGPSAAEVALAKALGWSNAPVAQAKAKSALGAAKPMALVSAMVKTPQGYYYPSNPPSQVTLAWDYTNDVTIAGFNLYYGVATRLYTNVVFIPGVTNTSATVQLVRSPLMYTFAVTATNIFGLESDFSDEVAWRPMQPPAPPSMHPIAVLQVESAPALDGPWFSDFNFGTAPLADAETNNFFRLRIVRVQP